MSGLFAQYWLFHVVFSGEDHLRVMSKSGCNSVSPQCITSVTTAHLCCCFVGLELAVFCFLTIGEQVLISF